MDIELEERLKKIISLVNSTLQFYELDYVSAKRLPEFDKIRCTSFEEYVGIRFNRECYDILPEIADIILRTDGKLFYCESLEDPNLAKRRFKTATIIINEKLPENGLVSEKDIEDVKKFLGWTKIKFNSVKKKIKFVVYD
jgi:hypothetical protein